MLSNFDATEPELAADVVYEGEKGMTDGLATDYENRIYLTIGEHDSIMRRNPDGHVEVVVRDRASFGRTESSRSTGISTARLASGTGCPGFNKVKDFHQLPYLLIRSPIVATPAIDHQA
jgi:hypothetical protein